MTLQLAGVLLGVGLASLIALAAVADPVSGALWIAAWVCAGIGASVFAVHGLRKLTTRAPQPPPFVGSPEGDEVPGWWVQLSTMRVAGPNNDRDALILHAGNDSGLIEELRWGVKQPGASDYVWAHDESLRYSRDKRSNSLILAYPDDFDGAPAWPLPDGQYVLLLQALRMDHRNGSVYALQVDRRMVEVRDSWPQIEKAVSEPT